MDDFALRPPEVNSGLMYAGPGSGPMLAAAAAWDAVAAELESTASGYSSEVSGLTGQAWFGPSSMRMAAAVTPYVAWLQATAVQTQQTAVQGYAAAAAYEAAFAMMVPPPVIAANRAQLMVLIVTNFFGQNTPAIAVTEDQYMAMWVQDATAMYGYAGASESARTLTAYSEPPQTTNPAGQAAQAQAQAQAMAQAAGNATSAHTQALAQLTSPTATHQLTVAHATAQQLSTTNTTAHTASFTGPVEPGQTVTAAPGNIITLGAHSAITVNTDSVTVTGAGAHLISYSAVTVNADSTVYIVSTCYEGSTLVPAGATVIAGSSPITLTPDISLTPAVAVQLVSGSAGVTNFGAVYAASNTATATVGSGSASITGVLSPATITTVAPVAPGSSSASGVAAAVGGLSSSPGLAGDAGIQPQLNVDALLEALSGAVPGGGAG